MTRHERIGQGERLVVAWIDARSTRRHGRARARAFSSPVVPFVPDEALALDALAEAPEFAGTLHLGLFHRVHAPPRVAVQAGLVDSLVVRGDLALGAADDGEVLDGPSGVVPLPEAPALAVDLLVLGAGEAVAVLLAHHDDGPLAPVEAVAGGALAVAQEAVELGLHEAGQLPDALVEVALVRLMPAAEEARGQGAFAGGVVAVDGGEGHAGQLVLVVGLGDAVDLGVLVAIPDVASANLQTAEGGLFDALVLAPFGQGPSLVDGLGDALLLWDAAESGQ